MAAGLLYTQSLVAIDGLRPGIVLSPVGLAVTSTVGSLASGVTAFTAVNRDTVGTAGGAPLSLTVAGATGTPNVTIAGVNCNSIVVVSANQITCTAPALTAGGPYDIVCGGLTITNAITVRASPGTIIATADFEGGSIPSPFFTNVSGGNSVAVSTAQAHSGTHSVLCQAAASSTVAGLDINIAQSQMLDNDFYMRWYIFIPSLTLTRTANNGQIKLHLCRFGNVSPAYIMLGEGSEFNSNNNSFASRIDNGVQIIATGPVITGDVWHEIQIYQRRNTATSTTTALIWYDGKLQGSTSSSGMGNNVGADTMTPEFGLVYTQNAAAHPLQVYVDDVKIANGFIDP